MSLLSLETVAEVLCVFQLIPKDFRFKKFLTSGSNEGVGCDVQNVYSWCSPGTLIIPELLQRFVQPTANAITERCLVYNADKAANGTALSHIGCSNPQLPFVCEPTCAGPTCPTGCKRNASLFGTDAKLKDPEKYGVWMQLCGETYLFGNRPVTWEQNWKTCCSIGMEPIIVDSFHQQCLNNATSNWKGNFNYWTGGTQQGCRGSWAWCGEAGVRVFDDGVSWDSGQPDNQGGRQDCVHLKLVKGSTGIQKFFLTDRNCTDRYVLACKGDPSRVTKCPAVNCSLEATMKPCIRDETKFTGSALEDFDSYGTWIGGCGKYFMFSSTKANWTRAQEICCSIGLTLAAVPTNGKRMCMDKMIQEFKGKKYVSSDFWLYGTDNGCSPGDYHWCSNYRQFEPREVNWGLGQPIRTMSCVYLNTTYNGTLATADCGEEKRFLCDVRKKGTSGLAMQQECLDTWGVTTAELDLLSNKSVDLSLVDHNLKCFIKCIGEFAGLFAAGGMMGGGVLRAIEAASLDDPVEMQQGFSAFDECSSITRDDECVTASDTYACGREKEPVIVESIITGEKGNSTIYNPPVPCIPFSGQPCFLTETGPPCLVNSTLRQQLLAERNVSFGSLVTLSLLSKEVFFSIKFTKMDFDTAMAYCCSIGMTLLDFNFPVSSFTTMWDNIYKTLIQPNGVLSPGGSIKYMYVGEVYKVDATHYAWCRTKETLPLVVGSKLVTLPPNTCVKQYVHAMSAYIDSVNVASMKFDHNDYITASASKIFVCHEP